MADKKSEYYGYQGVAPNGGVIMFREPTKSELARGTKQNFDLDREGMKTGYESYKRKGDPSVEEMSNRLKRYDEDAVRRIKQANKEEDREYIREENRAKAMKSLNETGSFKKGGKIKAKKMASDGVAKSSSASRRADGCAQRGKTKGRII